jgi:hypothetical protein
LSKIEIPATSNKINGSSNQSLGSSIERTEKNNEQVGISLSNEARTAKLKTVKLDLENLHENKSSAFHELSVKNQKP